MKAQPEIFKGIEYVRISSLPGEQREKIWGSFQHGKIIKIVKDQALLNDCILYQDYETWLRDQQAGPAVTGPRAAMPGHLNRLAFK